MGSRRDRALGIGAVSLAACIAVSALSVGILMRSGRVRDLVGIQGWSSPGYRVGQQVDAALPVRKDARLSLVIFARATCLACQRAMPGLARVAREARDATVDVLVVSAPPGSSDDQAFAEQIAGPTVRLLRVSPLAVRARRVPTTLLVARDGRIRFVAQGDFTEEQERVLRALMRGSE